MWYRTGTVTLKKGTNKVLGTSTKWLDKLSNVEAGQPLIVNGNIYEITEVRSDTELYLKEPALADATNSTYVIMSVVYGSLGDVALKASKALAHYQEQMDVFDMMYTGTQPFIVTKPDGSQIEMYPYSMLSVNLAQINDAIQKTATSATNAKASETSAKNSATSATTSAMNAKTSETNAKTSETNAKNSETASKTSETNAKNSAAAAATSATNAKTSETNAKNYADKMAEINVDNVILKNKNLEDVPDKEKALAHLGAMANTAIANNVTSAKSIDVNTLTKLGFYSIAGNSLNWLGSSGGILLVLPHGTSAYITQIGYMNGGVYVRYLSGTGAWGAWSSLANLNQSNIFNAPQEIRANAVNLTIRNASVGSLAFIKFSDIDGTDYGFIGRSVSNNKDLRLHNYISNKSLVLKESGILGYGTLYSENEVLTTANGVALNAQNQMTAQIPIIFDRDLASYMLSRKLDGKYRTILGLIANGPDIPLILRRYNENGVAASQLELHTDGQAKLLNFISNKAITVTSDGKYTTTNGEILHTGNASTYNGVGSTATILLASSTFLLGKTYTGPEIGARSSDMYSLSGTWVCVSVDKKTFGAQMFIAVSFMKIY